MVGSLTFINSNTIIYLYQVLVLLLLIIITFIKLKLKTGCPSLPALPGTPTFSATTCVVWTTVSRYFYKLMWNSG